MWAEVKQKDIICALFPALCFCVYLWSGTIGRQVLRGKLDAPLAEKMKRLAKNKLLRAISDNVYAQSKYELEMTQEALLAEARKK